MAGVLQEAPVRRALISVSDKRGIKEFAAGLSGLGIEILSTGGTYRALSEQGLAVREVADYTGFPEIMNGRVKTLHPKIHGGILARRGTDDAALAEHQIETIDLVIVNLYPFTQTIAKPDSSFGEAIENIDIGGPCMIRAAAKNCAHVAVITDPDDYSIVLQELKARSGSISGTRRLQLAQKAFAHTATYDSAITRYLHEQTGSQNLVAPFIHSHEKLQDLRYGENPHQRAAFYREADPASGTIASARQHQGKELSYNNIADTDAALECVKRLQGAACVIVKHANPCGAAEADTLSAAYEAAYATDSTSAFGGIIAFSQQVEADCISTILERQFVEVIVAPGFSNEALVAAAVKPNVRMLSVGNWQEVEAAGLDLKKVSGGLLVQDADTGGITLDDLTVVSKRQPDEKELQDLLFAWRVARFVKSNAIVYARDGRTIGVGAGQMSRIDSARIGVIKAENAELQVSGSVMASDAFFPFRDGIDAAAAAGVHAVIQPGGSMRDEEVIAAADEANMAMVFTGRRHFRH